MEKEQKPEQAGENGGKRVNGRQIAGILLIAAGILAIISVFAIPAINRKNNDKDIEDIRSGKYADPIETDAETITPEAVSPESIAAPSGTAVQTEPSERDQKLQTILADNSRIGIVEIDKIDVLYAIVEGTEDEQINRAVGHLTESAGIGEQGNCVIAGHRGGYFGTFFERLPELETGDVVKLTDLNGKEYHYSVYDKRMVEPADWSVIKELEDKHTLTMITCEDDTRKRIVVSAVLFTP